MVQNKRNGNPKDQGEMSFLEHLEALRWHLIRAIASIFIFGVFVFLAKDFIFQTVILGPKYPSFPTYQFVCNLLGTFCGPKDFVLITTTLQEEFLTHLKVSVLVGIIVAFPYIFWEVWRFIKPGLYENERKAARGMVFICSALFLTGVLFGYFVVAPFAITFLAGYSVGADVATQPRLSSYVNLMAMLTLPVGLVFELPVVVYFLSKIGLITPEFMRQYRKHAFVIILIVAAIVTPPDVITQFLIGIPLYLLYEISIFISQRVVDKQEKENQ